MKRIIFLSVAIVFAVLLAPSVAFAQEVSIPNDAEWPAIQNDENFLELYELFSSEVSGNSTLSVPTAEEFFQTLSEFDGNDGEYGRDEARNLGQVFVEVRGADIHDQGSINSCSYNELGGRKGTISSPLSFIDGPFVRADAWICNNFVPSEIAEDALDSAGDQISETGDSARAWATEAFESVVHWIAGRPSLITTDGWAQTTLAVNRALFTITIGIVAAGVLWQALRIIWNKSGVPLADLIKSIGIFVFVSITGVFLVQLASAASDELAANFISSIDLEELEDFQLPVPEAVGDVVVAIWSLLLIVGLAFQFIAIFVKEIGVVIASGALALAAAGQFFNFSKQWLDKIIGAVIGFMVFKPFIALSLAIGFEMMKIPGIVGVMAGGVTVFMTAFGIGPLMKIFTNIDYAGSIGSGSSMGTGAVIPSAGRGAPTGAS